MSRRTESSVAAIAALSLSVFGRNLTDEVYYTAMGQNALTTAANFGMPRTYGVSVGYTF